MWCRAVLATVVALTYIVCVLILNGLQKEDLDVNTLKKLQRHNVNIDDMNNEALRKECETATKNPSTNQNVDKPVTLKTVLPDIKEKQEDQNIKLSDSNLQNIIINYFNNVQKTNKPNYKENAKNEETKSSTDSTNVENFVSMWNMLSKTKGDVESTTKAFQSSTVLIDRTIRSNIRSDDKSMEYINMILEKLMTIQKSTTTRRPTTKSVDFDIIAQKIKEILSNTNHNQDPLPTQLKVGEGKFGTDKVNEEIEVLHNDSIQYIDDIIKLSNPFEMFGSVRNQNSSNRNIHFEDNNVQYQTKRRYLVNDVGPLNIITNAPIESQRYKNHFINRQIKTLSEDIIKEISESVRARVLQDLHKVITTTKRTKTTTTMETTTAKPTEKSTTVKVKYEPKNEKIDAKDMLEKFMEMFQQLKGNKDTELNKINENKNLSKASAHTANLPAENIYATKPLPVNITSVIINPYNPIQTPLIQTAILPNQPYTLLNINTPIQNVPVVKPLHKITQLNIFNTKNNYHTSPITIQTNSVEVPPLGLPAQQSVVYQNIVVSTKQPLDFSNVRHDFRQSYISQERKHYGGGNKRENLQYPPQPKELYNEYEISRHDRSREFINEEYSKEINRRKPIKYKKKYGRSHYSDHNSERFHEKLERADDWPRVSRSRENRNTDYDYGSSKLITRHQLPLSSAKKQSRYDDVHFRNFLQTQQKVNDMLERILATKTIANRPLSVETTV